MTSNSASLYITQIRFCRALAVVRSLPTESGGKFQPSTTDKLNFYGLYKQAIVGDCMLLKPTSRNIVQYAKWKAWDKLRGVSPIDAQIMYIEALIDLLKEFLTRYPNSELTESLIDSVHYLEETEETSSHDLQEEKWDTNDQENEDFYLGQIEQDQILSENQFNSYYSSPVTAEFPITPELSPRHHLLSPKHSHRQRSIASSISPHQQHYTLDQISESDDPKLNSSKQHLKKSHSRNRQNNKAIQTLQMEVAALCEEIDQLRRNDIAKTRSMFKWRWLWLFKSIAKHAFFNFMILMMLFIVLWRRKSPIAYAVISYAGPRLKDFMSYIFNRLVFWKA